MYSGVSGWQMSCPTPHVFTLSICRHKTGRFETEFRETTALHEKCSTLLHFTEATRLHRKQVCPGKKFNVALFFFFFTTTQCNLIQKCTALANLIQAYIPWKLICNMDENNSAVYLARDKNTDISPGVVKSSLSPSEDKLQYSVLVFDKPSTSWYFN